MYKHLPRRSKLCCISIVTEACYLQVGGHVGLPTPFAIPPNPDYDQIHVLHIHYHFKNVVCTTGFSLIYGWSQDFHHNHQTPQKREENPGLKFKGFPRINKPYHCYSHVSKTRFLSHVRTTW